MPRTIAKSIIRLLQSDKFCLNPDENIQSLIDLLITYPVKTSNFLMKKYPLLKNSIETLSQDELTSKFYSWYVVGCPTSTDIDIIVLVLREYIINSSPLPLSTTELERLRTELSSCGYDLSRGIDMNIMCIENGLSIGQAKGGVETTNILTSTYQYHEQKYQLDFNITFIHSTVIDRIRAIAKFILDYLDEIVFNYAEHREERRRVYMQGTENIIKHSVNLIRSFVLDPHSLSERRQKKWFDFIKSITMKIIQLILLKDNIYEYTKDKMAILSEGYGFNSEHIQYFLFRGKRGTFSESTLQQILSCYIASVEEYFETNDPITIRFPKESFENHTQMPPELFDEFIKSPNAHTEHFEKLWAEYEDRHEYQTLFEFDPTPIEQINLPTELKEKHFLQMPQRSESWFEAMKFYRCGSNGAEIKQTMKGTYNLLRGSITESIIMQLFNPEQIGLESSWQKVIVGLLVKDKSIKGSRGAAPDLLFVNKNQIIPVEIKTLTDGTHNGEFFNKARLAHSQCNSIREIMDSTGELNLIHKNLVIMSYWKETELVLECFLR